MNAWDRFCIRMTFGIVAGQAIGQALYLWSKGALW